MEPIGKVLNVNQKDFAVQINCNTQTSDILSVDHTAESSGPGVVLLPATNSNHPIDINKETS